MEFTLNLTGNFSAALGPVKKSLGDTSDGLKKTTKDVQIFEHELGKAKTTIGGLTLDFGALAKGGSLFSFNIADGIAAAVGVVKSLATAVLDLGVATVKSAANFDDLNLAVRLNLNGDRRAAEEIDALANSFSNTRFDDDEIKKALLPLLDAGIKDTRVLDNMATAAVDVSERQQSGLVGVQQALDAFKVIAVKRQVSAKQLVSLGINEQDFYKALGDNLRTSAEQAKKMAQKGEASSEDLLRTAYGEIARRQGGALGVAALEGGKTLGATLRRLDNLPNNLLKQLAGTPGVTQLQGVLDNFVTVMSGPAGTALMKQVGEALAVLGDTFLKPLASPEGLKSLGSTLMSVVDGVKSFVAWLGSARAAFAGFGGMINAIADAFNTLGRALASLGTIKGWESIGRFLGGPLATGIASGVEAERPALRRTGETTIAELEGGARDYAEVRSPSRLFARLGGDLAAGLTMGIDEGAPDARRAAQGMIAGEVLSPVVGGQTTMLGDSRSVGPITVEISIAAGHVDDKEALARMVGEHVEVRLRRIIDDTNEQLGAGATEEPA